MTVHGDTIFPKTRHVLGKIIEYWALGGGLLLLLVVLINAWSLATTIAFNKPVPGDFELVEVGVAVAVFSFLPYCQLTGSNVTADIFTNGMSQRAIGRLQFMASAIAVGFALLLLHRMYYGLLDFRLYEETTAIHQFPIWVAFVPILISLCLLVVAAFLSLIGGHMDPDAAKAGSQDAGRE